jgi:hypothetical protein
MVMIRVSRSSPSWKWRPQRPFLLGPFSFPNQNARNVASPALLAASSIMPMPILDEEKFPDPVGVGGGTKSK